MLWSNGTLEGVIYMSNQKLMEAAMVLAAQELERACQRALFERDFKETQDYIEALEKKMAAEKEAAEARRAAFDKELEARMNNSSLKPVEFDDDFIARAHAAWAKMGIK